MRQGCLLSPLSFILVLQVLNRNVIEMRLTGLKIKKEMYKHMAFVDLVLILEKNPLGRRIDVVMEK